MSAATEAVEGAIRTVLGDEATGLTHGQQFARLASKITTQATSPEAMAAHHGDVVDAFSGSHPELAQGLSAQMATAVQHLHAILPKSSTTPAPFQDAPEYQPTHTELHAFKKQLAVANDPFHLLNELEDGTLTGAQIATAQALHPAILGQIQQKVLEEAATGKTQLPYAKRLQLSLLMGQPMDSTLKNVQQIQASYAAPTPQPQGSPGAGPVSKSGKFNMSTDRETNAQRLAGYGGG